jgi:hypothetical protein
MRNRPRTTVSAARKERGLTTNEAMSLLAKKKNKYKAAGRKEDGHWFASGAEADRYLQLKALAAQDRIANLRCQQSYDLTANGKLICRYRADFTYDVLDERGRLSRTVIEDIKGMITDVYALKAKMMAAHGHNIHEIPSKEVPKWNGRIPEGDFA